jgi:hypothetical protein
VILIKLTRPQAEAASNAADLIADSLRADGRHREAALYQRVSDAIALAAVAKKAAKRPPR